MPTIVDKHTINSKNLDKRGGSKVYYDKSKNKEYMKTHRSYKKELLEKELI